MIDIKKVSRLFADKNRNGKKQWPKFNSVADATWIREQSSLPWIKLEISIPDYIHSEILNIKHLLVDHRDSYGEHKGWRSFCIHGKAYDATREDAHYNDTRPYIWTPEAEELMPQTVEYFKHTWPNAGYRRLRIMELAPGGIISVHKDAQPPDALRAVNIAITQPNGCEFIMENYGTVPFTKSSAYMLNISNNHTVINDSEEYRFHIIAHQEFNKDFDNMLVTSYNKTYAS
jgi:Aspartyl/Asparaginyl beta-hydroxylase